MKAVVRLGLTYLAAFPVVRWVGLFAAGTIVLAVATLGAPPALLLAGLATFIYAFCIVMPAGFLLRLMSAPRVHRLLPHFRVKMLAAILAVLAVVLAVWFAAHWFGSALAGRQPSFGDLLAYPALIVTCAVLGTYFLYASQLRFFALLLLFFASLPLFRLLPEDTVQRFSGDPAQAAFAAAWVSAAWWVLFSFVYLRNRPIQPVGAHRPSAALQSLDDSLLRSMPPDIRASRAATALLTGRIARPLVQGLVMIAVLGIILVPLALWLTGDVDAPGLTRLLTHGLPLALATEMFALANRTARRARTLWLKVGATRGELFRRTEAELLRVAAPMMVAAIVIPLCFFAIRTDMPSESVLWVFSLAVGNGLFACYLGLMFVRGFRAADIVGIAAGLAAVAYAAWLLLGLETMDPLRMTSVLVFQLLGAAACRGVARRRWRRIDWFRFRPLRFNYGR